MGRIVSQIRLENILDSEKNMEFSAMVDTGAACLTLPKVWRDHFGKVFDSEEVELATATQEMVKGELCGPFKIVVNNFRPVYLQVLFIDMQPDEDNDYDPLLGYIPLESIPVAVDMLGHRLVPVKYFDLK